MPVLATLHDNDLRVEPGATAVARITVQNNSNVVDAFTFEVLGEASAFATVQPVEVPLLPHEQKDATITFSPPKSAVVEAKRYVYGVRVMARKDPADTVVEEGALTVAPFGNLTGTLHPQTATAASSGRVRVRIENQGNSPVQVWLAASDPDELLDFRLDRSTLTVPPGGTAEAVLGIRHRNRPLRGQETRHRYTVVGSSNAASPLTMNGELVQRPYLARWIPKLAAAVLAVGLVAGGLAALLATRSDKVKVDTTQAAATGGVAAASSTTAGLAGAGGADGGGAGAGGPSTSEEGAGGADGGAGVSTPTSAGGGGSGGEGGTAATETTAEKAPAPDPALACKEGFVFREAGPFDRTCVTSAAREQVKADNAAAASRRAGSGSFGPDGCKQGFVWREALPLPIDRTCVAGAARDQAKDDNGQATARRQPPNDVFTCMKGFVWREAVAGDLVCVTPGQRNQVSADNAAAGSRWNVNGGQSGPEACKAGFVWRDAFPLDSVCVTGDERTQVATDNKAAQTRFANDPGPYACKSDSVWRQIVVSDLVCVAQPVRDQVIADNAAARSHRAYPPNQDGYDGCQAGFVWRSAFAGDHVCVTLATHDQAAADNAAAPSRRVG